MGVVVQSLSRVRLFATPWTAAHQASLSFTNSRCLLKLGSIESMMRSNHLILRCPLLLLPSTFPIIRVFSIESALCNGTGRRGGFCSFSLPHCEKLRKGTFHLSFRVRQTSGSSPVKWE